MVDLFGVILINCSSPFLPTAAAPLHIRWNCAIMVHDALPQPYPFLLILVLSLFVDNQDELIRIHTHYYYPFS